MLDEWAQKLLNEKLEIQQKIKDFEQTGNNWLEPMKEMILASSQAKILFFAERQFSNSNTSKKYRLELYFKR